MLDPVTNLQHQPVRTLGFLLQEVTQTALQILMLCLLLLGMGGLAFKAVGEGGWLPAVLGQAWSAGPGYLAAASMGLLLAGYAIKRFFYRRPAAINRSGDMLVYGCLGLGAFFALRLILTGTL